MADGQRRRLLRSQPRARTIPIRRPIPEEWGDGDYPDAVQRPQTRDDCTPCDDCQKFVRELEAGAAPENPPCGHDPRRALLRCRPCPFVSCEGHFYTDVNRVTGAIKFNFPHLEPTEIPETCVNDVAERGPMTLDAIGDLMNLTRERIRQVETKGQKGFVLAAKRLGLFSQMTEWLAERDAQLTFEEIYPSPVQHGDGPALAAMIARWERRAGLGMVARVYAVLRDEECTVPMISKRLPGQTHRPSIRIALRSLEDQGKIEKRIVARGKGTITYYRRRK